MNSVIGTIAALLLHYSLYLAGDFGAAKRLQTILTVSGQTVVGELAIMSILI